MAESKKVQRQNHEPHGRRDRDSASDRPHKRHDYTAGANGDQDVNAAEAADADAMRPDKDGTGW